MRRAQEALRQLESGAAANYSRTAQGARTTGGLPACGDRRPERHKRSLSWGLSIGLIVIVLVIVALVSSSQQTAVPNAATIAARQELALNTAVPTATIDPNTYTATPF